MIKLLPVTMDPANTSAFYIGPGGVDVLNHPWWDQPPVSDATVETLLPDGTVRCEWKTKSA